MVFVGSDGLGRLSGLGLASLRNGSDPSGREIVWLSGSWDGEVLCEAREEHSEKVRVLFSWVCLSETIS